MGKATERLQGVTLRDRPQSVAEVKFGLDQAKDDPGKSPGQVLGGAGKEAVRQTLGHASKALNDGLAGISNDLLGGTGDAKGADWFGVSERGAEKAPEASQKAHQNDGFGM